MDNEKKNSISKITKNNYTIEDAIREFDELKNMALNCFDKNGNPNISAALKAIEGKARVAGLYKKEIDKTPQVVTMSAITIDGEQLKLNIGEEFFNNGS